MGFLNNFNKAVRICNTKLWVPMNNTKVWLKNRNMNNKILIASIPRSGSTYLLRVCMGLSLASDYPVTSFSKFVINIKRDSFYGSELFYKTHDFAPENIPENVKALFLFSNPIDAVLSTLENRFDANTFALCHCKRKDVNIIDRDDLNYEKMFITWTSPNKQYPVLAIRYEKLNENIKTVSDFIGKNIVLPKWKPRKLYKPHSNIERRLNITYGSLINRIEKFPDIKEIPGVPI